MSTCKLWPTWWIPTTRSNARFAAETVGAWGEVHPPLSLTHAYSFIAHKRAHRRNCCKRFLQIAETPFARARTVHANTATHHGVHSCLQTPKRKVQEHVQVPLKNFPIHIRGRCVFHEQPKEGLPRGTVPEPILKRAQETTISSVQHRERTLGSLVCTHGHL